MAAHPKIEAAMCEALKRDNADLSEYSEEYLAALAEMLAERLDAKRARSLAYNLPRNPEIRRALLSGAITVAEMCAMDPAELASDAVKRARADAAERAEARLRSGGAALSSVTHAVCCPECKAREALFTHVGNDAREWHGRKNEVWGSKHDDDEGPACQFECLVCQHRWTGDVPLEVEEEPPAVARRGILGWKGSLRD